MINISSISRLCAAALIAIISGCGGPVKPDIPKDIAAIPTGMARIVFVREDQLAGAGSPMVVLDVGNYIQPNAMLAIRNINLKDLLQTESDKPAVGITPDKLWLWFNPDRVNPLYCADHKPTCIVYHRRWPKQQQGQVIYGTVLRLHGGCAVDIGYVTGKKAYEAIREQALEPVKITGFSGCKDVHYTNPGVITGQFMANKPSLYMRFDEFIRKNPKGFRVPGIDGYILLVDLVTEKSSYPASIRVYPESIDYDSFSRQVQVIGSAEVGDTLIWDRKPGIMRLGSGWYDGIGFMSKNIRVEAGKTYFIRYTTGLGQRWQLEKVE